MDAERFEALLRTVSTMPSRRGFVRLLTGLALAGPLVNVGLTEAAAKRKHKKKRHRTAPPPGCTPSCERKICGDDGCGGSCGDCPSGFTCDGGRCGCPSPRALMCGGCVDLLTDPQHCGLCSVACDSGFPNCVDGMCCGDSLCRCSPEGSACNTNTCCDNGACLATGVCP